MASTNFVQGQILFREGDPANSVFRLVSGAVDILRELDGEPILLGTVGAGQFIGEMGVVENRPRSATARAASDVQVEILTPAEFLDQIAGSPRAARELIQRLSQRLREADDRIVNDERRSGRALVIRTDADHQTVRDLRSTLGTTVNGEPIGNLFRTDDVPLRAGDNEVIAGGVGSPFVFSILVD
jgi:CRP-like cAMP-binding protein